MLLFFMLANVSDVFSANRTNLQHIRRETFTHRGNDFVIEAGNYSVLDRKIKPLLYLIFYYYLYTVCLLQIV